MTVNNSLLTKSSTDNYHVPQVFDNNVNRLRWQSRLKQKKRKKRRFNTNNDDSERLQTLTSSNLVSSQSNESPTIKRSKSTSTQFTLTSIIQWTIISLLFLTHFNLCLYTQAASARERAIGRGSGSAANRRDPSIFSTAAPQTSSSSVQSSPPAILGGPNLKAEDVVLIRKELFEHVLTQVANNQTGKGSLQGAGSPSHVAIPASAIETLPPENRGLTTSIPLSNQNRFGSGSTPFPTSPSNRPQQQLPREPSSGIGPRPSITPFSVPSSSTGNRPAIRDVDADVDIDDERDVPGKPQRPPSESVRPGQNRPERPVFIPSSTAPPTTTTTTTTTTPLPPPIEVIQCGGNITLTNSFTLTSPNYGDGKKYPRNTECLWRIQTSSDRQSIRIKIKNLEIEDDVDCKYDYLEIAGHRRLCGIISGKELAVNSTQVSLLFRSDSNYEDRGFEIEISSEMPECVSKVLVTSPGTINSPLFPANYPNSMDCWTIIEAGRQNPMENVTLTLQFEVLDLEEDEKCAYDFVEIYDGNNIKSSKSLGRFCQMTTGAAHGLRPESSLLPHELPDPRAQGNPDEDGSQPGQPPTLVLKSTGPYLLVHFHSDQLLSSRGYKAVYQVESLERSSGNRCNWAPNTRDQLIASPNWPAQYPPNVDCEMILKAPSSSERIVIIFDSFTMEADSNCSFDRLEIYDPQQDTQSNARARRPIIIPAKEKQEVAPTRTLCGRKTSKFKFVSQGPKLKLRFFSDDFAEYSGFTARYQFVPLSGGSVTTTAPEPLAPGVEVYPRERRLPIGSSVLLTCSNPKQYVDTRISWLHEDKEISENLYYNGTNLLIKEFSSHSQGRYLCKMGNLTGEAHLRAQDTADDCAILFKTRPKDKVMSEGDFGLLECSAVETSSGTLVDIYWERNGERVYGNTTRVEQYRNGFLVINGAEVQDSGFYFCVAKMKRRPNCVARAAAFIQVNERCHVNCAQICGRPTLGQPSKQKPKLDTHGKIVGGTEAAKGAFPWQTMFWDWNRKSFCGGALLNERWVVTAAHCFPPQLDLSAVEVKLGKHDQSIAEEHEKISKIKDIVKHPDFNRDTFDNDLALVRLTDHVSFSDYIRPVCLGESKMDIEEAFFVNQQSLRMGHVTGWGQLKEHGGQPRFLQEIRVPIVSQDTCKASTAFRVTSNMYCAGYSQEILGDACKGDSGGPFVARHEERWYLLGIVSWGEGCGRKDKYGFYTKVNNYLDWIKAIIKS